MKLIKNYFAFLLICAVLFSCAKIDSLKAKIDFFRKDEYLQKLNDSEGMLKTKGGYDSYLALEYLQFSRSLITIKKIKEGKYFAKKGFEVMNGERVIPESPLDWNADKAQIEEMLLMQRRLEIALQEPQMKEIAPIQLSHLSYLYDCWISRESKEIFRTSDLAYCKSRFYKLIDEIEYYIEQSKKDNKPQVKIKEPEFKRFEVLFDVGSSEINNEGQKNIITILEHIVSLDESYRILVVGNGDRIDIAISDKNLAFKRAETVREYLIKNGVDKNAVQLRLIGEDFPDIISKSGELIQPNRKVGVYILKGVESFFSTPLSTIKNDIYKSDIKKARQDRGL